MKTTRHATYNLNYHLVWLRSLAEPTVLRISRTKGPLNTATRY